LLVKPATLISHVPNLTNTKAMMSDNILDDLLSDSLKNDTDDREAQIILAPLAEEIELIKDIKMQEFVKIILLHTLYFWVMPVYPDDNEELDDIWPPDTYRPGGDVLNTQRVVRGCEILSDSYGIGDEDKNILYAAALIHSVTKYVYDSHVDGPRYDPMHPYTVDTLVTTIREREQLRALEGSPNTLSISDEQVMQILRIVRCQRGPWSLIPETIPVALLEILLHTSYHMAMNLDYLIDGKEILGERWDF
jgi:hypothetical protein